jgi:hypothetical protein
MQQSQTPRLARWVSLPMPGLELLAWRGQRSVALAQLWPVFGVLVLLCAALWGISAYTVYKADLRRAETGRYLAEFRESPVADAWQHLGTVWQSEERRQNILLERMEGRSGAELERALHNYRDFVLDTVEEHRLEGDIETVRSFFARLGVCVRIGSCDPTVARAQLGPALWHFRNQHYEYLAREGETAEVDRVVRMIAPEEPAGRPGRSPSTEMGARRRLSAARHGRASPYPAA